jgi:voltage-gated potassium channel
MSPTETNPVSGHPDNAAKGSPSMAELADWEQDTLPEPHECTGNKRAYFMFRVAVGALIIIGLMAGHGISDDTKDVFQAWWLGIPLLALWVVVIFEGLLGMAMAHDHHWNAFKRFLLVIICPPIRAAVSPAYPNRFVWLPKHDWLAVGKLNFERMELRFALPMLGVTLLVLPLLGVELMLADWLELHLWAAIIVHILTAVVWVAFALEFTILLSLADKKLAYCKQHWINIVIILLPLFGFLRALQFLRAGRATKLIRAYRMRGVVSRTMRLAMLFNLIERLLERNPEKYLLALKDKVAEKKAEIQALEEKMGDLQARIAKEKEAVDATDAPAEDSSLTQT